jgi:hypothetical protein
LFPSDAGNCCVPILNVDVSMSLATKLLNVALISVPESAIAPKSKFSVIVSVTAPKSPFSQ